MGITKYICWIDIEDSTPHKVDGASVVLEIIKQMEEAMPKHQWL